MNKNNWKENLETLKDRLNFLKLSDDVDLDSPLKMEEELLPSEEEALPGSDLGELLRRRRQRRLVLWGIVIAVVVCAVAGFYLYNRLHTFRDYVISRSIENTMTSGTQYESVGKYLYRYNSDGVSCVSRSNEVQWSVTYSMQAPIVDVCGTTMAIAEQQGTQVYVVNEDGLAGNFETLLPILKVRVSKQGVVAVVLQDDDVTWVNLYDADGDAIASNKTTISDSGYPLDVDLSPNGEKMAVSYLEISQGVMTSDIVFYNFGSGGNSANDYVVSSESLAGSVVPEVYFIDNSNAVAIADDGFVVFKGANALEKAVECWFDDEIISCFHEDDCVGFLFNASDGGNTFRMELYNYKGKQTASAGVDASFDEIKMENGQILMYTSSACSVYTEEGRLRFSSSYEKEIVDIFFFGEFRRYMIITQDSFDRIRIC